MKTSATVKEIANEKDKEALEHITKIESIPSKDGKQDVTTYRFHFKEDNDFFKNTLLEVKCWLDDAGEETVVTKTEASEIEWLEGKDPTKKKIKKKQKHKKTGESRTVMKTVDCQSLFNIFQDLKRPARDEPELDEEEAIELEDKMDAA